MSGYAHDCAAVLDNLYHQLACSHPFDSLTAPFCLGCFSRTASYGMSRTVPVFSRLICTLERLLRCGTQLFNAATSIMY